MGDTRGQPAQPFQQLLPGVGQLLLFFPSPHTSSTAQATQLAAQQSDQGAEQPIDWAPWRKLNRKSRIGTNLPAQVWLLSQEPGICGLGVMPISDFYFSFLQWLGC